MPSLRFKTDQLPRQLSYTKFLQDVRSKLVDTAQISNGTGEINGKLKNGVTYSGAGAEPVASQRRDRNAE